MRYEGRIYRPPSEADALILQATIGCSWNHCTYCDMYSDKQFRVRALEPTLADLDTAAAQAGAHIDKVFVADGDALVMPLAQWRPILERARARLPRLRRVSCYAMARNVLAKTDDELAQLRALGLSRLYIGPESGDDATLRRIAKGDDAAAHVEAATRAHAAGMELSVITLLGIAGERSEEHARATGELITAMDPEFVAALTVTVVPGTPLAKLAARDKLRGAGGARAAAGAAWHRAPRAAEQRYVPHQPRLELPAAGRAAAGRSRAHRRGHRCRARGPHPAAARAVARAVISACR
ncbi:MAG: radical SAM protein [Deltaproteobacteria bacterium]|nr:radical SAM protein [Deltaproteobacteria bacterium]